MMSYKNLLIISNDFPNQDNSYVADVFVKEQLKYLKNYFNEVYVISPVAFGMERLRNTIYSDYQYDNVKVYFPKYFNIPFCYSQGRSIWKQFEQKAVTSLIKKERLKIDIIHAHFTWPSGAIAVDIKNRYNVPVIITEHTHISLYKELERNDHHYINALKNCDAIIRVNKKDIPLIKKYCGLNAKIFHIVNGFDPKKYRSISQEEARRILQIPINKKIILNISNLIPVKLQKDLIIAMSYVKNERDDCICYIGGKGPERDNLSNKILDLNIQDNVILQGFIPDEEMFLWMNACDIFVLPSLSEGNPTVMFEALGCGKPFVGTKVGGVPEIITSDDYGLLVEPGDPEDLAKQILVALDHEWDSKAILAYAEKFTWDNISKEILDIYSKLM